MQQPFALHVERAAAINRAVLDCGGKWIDFPRCWFCGDDVHVAEKDEGTLRTVTFKPRDDVCASRLVFKDLVLNAVLVEDLLKEPCRFDLVTRRVRSIDTQILLHQINRHVLIPGPINRTTLR